MNFDLPLPYLRLATAMAPLLCAMVVRLVAGRNRVTRFLLSASTTWLAVNVLLAPFTDPIHVVAWLRR